MDRYLSPQEVCELIPGMTPAKLAKLRHAGTGPTFKKPTVKTVVYRESEITAWLEGTSRTSTSEQEHA